MKRLLVLSTCLFLVSTGWSQDKIKKIHVVDSTKKILQVEVSCGQCKFGLKEKGCDLAVRIDGKAYFVDPPNADKTNTGKLKVSFFGPFYGAYNIMVLDKPYYNYVMICGPDKSYLWILSRTPQLAYPIKQHLTAQAKELGFDTEQLIHVVQSAEIINYKAGPHVNK